MRHRTLLLIAAVTGLLACACGGTEAERLHRAAMREYLDPIRPGYEGRNPFWNAFATKFIYAPAFGFEPVENAVKYRFTVSHLGTSMVESPRYRKDAPTEDPEPRRVLGPGVPTGRSWSFEADSPQQSLAPVWNDIPAGRVRVTAEGLDASGRVLGKAGEREFLRDFPFRPPYNGNVRPYAEAARMAALYIHELLAIRRWLTAAEPDMTYRHNTYACKIVGATIQLEVLVAKLLPAHREEALAIARNAARFLMDRSRPEGDPLAFFPPTYYSDLISSSRAENRGKTMTMEACLPETPFSTSTTRRATGSATTGRWPSRRPTPGCNTPTARSRSRSISRPGSRSTAARRCSRRSWSISDGLKTSTASPATAAASPGRRSGCAATHSKVST